MVPVIERAGVFDWVCDEVAVDQRRPGNRAMHVRRWHDGERQHSNHSPNRYADPENPPFPQDIEYIGQLTSCVKAASGLYGTLFVFARFLKYSLAVRRLLYACLAVAIAGLSTPSRSLHVHVSVGHSHHEHEHGPASHEHQRHVPLPAQDGPRLSSCDPVTHAVFLNHTPKVFSATATYATAVLVADPFAIAPRPARYRILARIEARQHSPPANTPVSPRPPPLTA
jgi:hypothetical protein